MWVVRAASFVLAVSLSLGQEAPKWSKPDGAEQNNGWIPVTRDQISQASARALSQGPPQNQLTQSPGFSQDVPLDSFSQEGPPVFRQREPTRVQQIFQPQPQYFEKGFPPQLLQHQLPPEFLNQQFQQPFGQQFSLGQPLLPPFVNPQESFIPPPPPPPPPPSGPKQQVIQGLRESNYNPNDDIKGLEPPRLSPPFFSDSNLQAGPPRKTPESLSPSPNDGKEEVQILYVPVETLKQRNKENNKGPSFANETPHNLRNEPPHNLRNEPPQFFRNESPRRPVLLSATPPTQLPVDQPVQIPVQRPAQVPAQEMPSNSQKEGEKKFRHPIQPLKDQKPALHLKNYLGLNPATGIIHTTPTPSRLRPEADSQLDTTQQVSTLIKTTKEDDRREYQAPATEPTQFNNFRNQQTEDTYFGTGSEHRSSVRPSPVTNGIPQLDDYTRSTLPPPNQPPLSVYMETSANNKVGDILSLLKGAKTIPVLDTIGSDSPQVFVGPSNLKPPHGYVKFELPYLSSLDGNRVEKKVLEHPFFVAPLNFQPPQGYSKIPFPPPHIGSVVLSNFAPKAFNPNPESPTRPAPEPRPPQYREPYTIPAEISSISPQLPSLINSLQEEDHYPSSTPQALTQSEEIAETTPPSFRKQTLHSRRRGGHSSTPRTTTVREELPSTRRPYSQRQRRPVNRHQSRFTPSPTAATTEEIENTPRATAPSQYLSETPQNSFEKDVDKVRYSGESLTTKPQYYNPHDATPSITQDIYNKPSYIQDYSKEDVLPTTESIRPTIVRTDERASYNGKESSEKNMRPFPQDFTNGENFRVNSETNYRAQDEKHRGSSQEQSRLTYEDVSPSIENQRFRNTAQTPSVQQLSQDDGIYRQSSTPGSSYRQDQNEYLSSQYNDPNYRTTPSAGNAAFQSSQESEYYNSQIHQNAQHEPVNSFQDSSSLTQTPGYEDRYVKPSQEGILNRYKDSREQQEEKSHFEGQHRLKVHTDEPKLSSFEEPAPTTQKYVPETTTEAHVEKTTQHRSRGRVRGRTYSPRRTTTEAPNYPSISAEIKDTERPNPFTDSSPYTSVERIQETAPTTQPPSGSAEQPSRSSSTGKFSRTRPLRRRPLRPSTPSSGSPTSSTTTSAPGGRYLIRTRKPTQVQTKLQTGRSRIRRPTTPTTTTEVPVTTKGSYSHEDFNESPVYTGHFPVNANRANRYENPLDESEPELKDGQRNNENNRFESSFVKSSSPSYEEREEEKYYDAPQYKKSSYSAPSGQEEYTVPHRHRTTESYDSTAPPARRFPEYDDSKSFVPKITHTTPVYQEDFTASNRRQPTESFETNNVRATAHSPTSPSLNDYDDPKASPSTPSSEENYESKVSYSTPKYEDDVKIKSNTFESPRRNPPQRHYEDSLVAGRNPSRHRHPVKTKQDKTQGPDDFWDQGVTIQQSKSYEYEPDSPVNTTPQSSYSTTPTTRKRKPAPHLDESDYEDYYSNQDTVKFATGDQAPFPSNAQQVTYTGGKDSLKIGKDNQYPVKETEVQEGSDSSPLNGEDSVKESSSIVPSTEKPQEESHVEESSPKPRPTAKGGKRRGVWVRVRVKKPADVFETAESQSFGSLTSNALHHSVKQPHGDKHWTAPDTRKTDSNETTASTTTSSAGITDPIPQETPTTTTTERQLTIMEQFQTTLTDMMKNYAGPSVPVSQLQSSTEPSVDISTLSPETSTTVADEVTTFLPFEEPVATTIVNDGSSIEVTSEVVPITSTPTPSLESKIVGTSTTTEISLETEICFRGRCVKTKRTKGKDDSDLMPIE